LHRAARNGYLKVVEYLVGQGADAELLPEEYKEKYSTIILEHGSDASRGPLYIHALLHNKFDLLQRFSQDANPLPYDHLVSVLIWHAPYRPKLDADQKKVLLAHLQRNEKLDELLQVLFHAIEQNDEHLVEQILSINPDLVNRPDDAGQTPLSHAFRVQAGENLVLNLLSQSATNVDPTDDHGSLLDWRSMQGDVSVSIRQANEAYSQTLSIPFTRLSEPVKGKLLIFFIQHDKCTDALTMLNNTNSKEPHWIW